LAKHVCGNPCVPGGGGGTTGELYWQCVSIVSNPCYSREPQGFQGEGVVNTMILGGGEYLTPITPLDTPQLKEMHVINRWKTKNFLIPVYNFKF